MRVAIVGSRDYERLDKVVDYVYSLPEDTIVVSGGARGVDMTAEKAAVSRELHTIIHLADWKKLGKAAGFIRNQFIVDDADRLVAFWNGSRGTEHSINLARRKGIPVDIRHE